MTLGTCWTSFRTWRNWRWATCLCTAHSTVALNLSYSPPATVPLSLLTCPGTVTCSSALGPVVWLIIAPPPPLPLTNVASPCPPWLNPHLALFIRGQGGAGGGGGGVGGKTPLEHFVPPLRISKIIFYAEKKFLYSNTARVSFPNITYTLYNVICIRTWNSTDSHLYFAPSPGIVLTPLTQN